MISMHYIKENWADNMRKNEHDTNCLIGEA